jgi:hypothetical protein
VSNISLAANSNVTIRCINKYGKVIRSSHIHNKATVVLVEGLLRYLKGDFTPSSYNLNSYDGDEAIRYIPAELRFGNIGVEINNRSADQPILSGINSSVFIQPTFNAYKLQQELLVSNSTYESRWDTATPKFESADISTYDDPNNSMSLLLQAFIPAGQLVGFKNQEEDQPAEFIPWTDEYAGSGRGWAFYNPSTHEYQTLLTEMGLYSGNNMLARVLFDGEITIDTEGVGDEVGQINYVDPNYDLNPIIQSETTSMIVEWRIGITSIGQNDVVSSSANILTNVILHSGTRQGEDVTLEYQHVDSFELPDELPEGWTLPEGTSRLSGWEKSSTYLPGETYNFIGQSLPTVEFTAVYE